MSERAVSIKNWQTDRNPEIDRMFGYMGKSVSVVLYSRADPGKEKKTCLDNVGLKRLSESCQFYRILSAGTFFAWESLGKAGKQ